MKAIRVLDYDPSPVQNFGKPYWNEYSVTVECDDGITREGFMQGDTHMWAFETFEVE